MGKFHVTGQYYLYVLAALVHLDDVGVLKRFEVHFFISIVAQTRMVLLQLYLILMHLWVYFAIGLFVSGYLGQIRMYEDFYGVVLP